MKTIAKTLFLLSLILVMAACQEPVPAYKWKLDVKPEPYELEFERYEEVLFNLDTTDFQAELMKIQGRYRVFLSGDLNNFEAVQYLKDFATDPFSIALYQKVKAAFPDLKEVEPLVEEVFAHFHLYYPDIALPKKVFTCITGVHPDEPPIQIIDNQLVISLDWYLNDEETYDQIGMPRYMSLRRNVPTLAKELAEQLYMFYIYEWRKQGQIVGEMVFYGRRNFFIEAMCPELTDSTLLGYSSDQWHWAVENEGQMWADIVGNRRLYDAGLDAYMMFFGDGPFTQAYSNDAPSRLGEFFGLNIIRSYFSNNEVSLQKLMERKDLQDIFQDSGYKPKK
ncbi:MAG: hypothetical protein J6T22_00685 [Bacteroidales bacterium]|nr:hypothetical protein [Bacteroidales bacterium]